MKLMSDILFQILLRYCWHITIKGTFYSEPILKYQRFLPNELKKFLSCWQALGSASASEVYPNQPTVMLSRKWVHKLKLYIYNHEKYFEWRFSKFDHLNWFLLR